MFQRRPDEGRARLGPAAVVVADRGEILFTAIASGDQQPVSISSGGGISEVYLQNFEQKRFKTLYIQIIRM